MNCTTFKRKFINKSLCTALIFKQNFDSYTTYFDVPAQKIALSPPLALAKTPCKYKLEFLLIILAVMPFTINLLILKRNFEE